MTKAQQDYAELLKIARHTKVLQGIQNLIGWDQETYMPHGASAIRAEQLSTLAGLIHQESTGKPFSQALAKLINLKTGKVVAKGLTTSQQAALREWRRDYLKETALPVDFVTEFTSLCSQSMEVWRSARQDNAFQRFAPYLERIIAFNLKKADLLGYKNHPYDALLDLYEPEVTTKEVEKLFGGLYKSLKPLLNAIVKAKPIDDSCLYGKYPHDKQMAFAQVILDAMGYDMKHGRVDISTHPFSSSSHPTDSRITTRINPESPMSHIFVILHEAGHSLYEMGLPTEHYGSPLASALSYGMHERQSRWWETRIGQSKPFWEFFLPKLKHTFKGQLDKVSLEEFYRAINKVQPSLIRVEADEVTYTMHVILRFEMERDLIEGTLKVRDIPEVWNAKMKEYLGITPPNNREGCLQDVHWSMGAFGYFPSYTLGNLYASHLFVGFEKAHPNWQIKVKKGDLLFIKDWLFKNVHQHGREFTSHELLKKGSGQAFSEKAFVHYLTDKYSKLYALK